MSKEKTHAGYGHIDIIYDNSDAGLQKYKILKDEYTKLAYKQTFCADPWPIGGTDSLTLKNLAAYLDSSGLYLAGLTIKKEADEDLCYACFCKTGKTIYATTLASDTLKARYGRLGFK